MFRYSSSSFLLQISVLHATWPSAPLVTLSKEEWMASQPVPLQTLKVMFFSPTYPLKSIIQAAAMGRESGISKCHLYCRSGLRICYLIRQCLTALPSCYGLAFKRQVESAKRCLQLTWLLEIHLDDLNGWIPQRVCPLRCFTNSKS